MRFSDTGIAKLIIDNLIDSAYCVGYRTSNKDFWEEDVSRFKVLKPGIRYWYADPIPCLIDNTQFVFVEKYDRFKQIGYIGISEMKKNGRLTRPRTVIKGRTHMSFPVIIFYKNEYYMFPESSAAKSIEIYKMEGSPYHWKHYYSVNLNEKIVDAAIKIDGDSLLILAGIEDENVPLYVRRQIIQIKSLEDLCEISYQIGYTDEEVSLRVRNGGNFFEKYRIIQESTETDYGMYLILSEVLDFDLHGISEKFCKRRTVENIDVDLSRFLYRKIGTHTYGKGDRGFEVIDLAVTKVSILPLLRKLGRKKK